MPTRADAYTLMTTHVKNENLQKHMLDLREHTQVLAQWLREGGYDERIIYAILTHNDLNSATHPRNDLLSKALYACDGITGMITAPAPITKCHSRKLSGILPELIALFGSAA
jgi:predicted hydrolase (HD superfamily)